MVIFSAQDPRWGQVALSLVGFEEFRGVLAAAVAVIATVATAAWATKAQIGRGSAAGDG